MNIKKMNPKMLGIIIAAVVIVCIIGITSTSSKADKEMIKSAKAIMEEEKTTGEFSGAEDAVSRASGGKAEKLYIALKDYNRIINNFACNYSVPLNDDVIEAGFDTGFKETYDSLKDLDGIYKKYAPFKATVNEWKDKLKTAMDYEKDLRKDYKKLKKLMADKEYEECAKEASKWNDKIEKAFPQGTEGITNTDFIERLEAFTYMFSEDGSFGYSISDKLDNNNKTKSKESNTESDSDNYEEDDSLSGLFDSVGENLE